MQDKATGKSRCFGFVTYKDSDLLDEVLSKKHSIDGKEIDCKRAIPRDQHPDSGKESGPQKTKKLFVGGLTQTTSEEEFRKYFEQFGTIEDSVIMVDKDTGKSRGFGFITFASEDSVDRVIERYNENKIDGKWVECKRAQAKDTMSAGSKKGGRHESRGPGGDHSRHGGGSRGADRSRGHGYYQSSPPSQSSDRRKGSSRGHPSQDSYGGGYYQGAYGQNYPQGTGYGEQGAYGGYPGYDYGPNAGGYDPSGNYNRGPAGYNYNPEYSAYNPNYGNPYPNSYNPAYNSGYPSQYQAGYPQTYDPMATGMGPVNPSATANPNMQQQQQQQQPSTTKTSDPSTGGTPGPQPTGAPTGQYPSGYGPESGYNPASYGYNPMQGDYSNAGYMGYGNPAQQGDSRNIQGGSQPKYGGPAQALSPSQSGGYGGKQEQPGVGPIRGGAKKGGPGPEQRYYQPY